MKKKLPVGIENFNEIILEDFYFVDKTKFIIDLLHGWGKVNLFTRPRRFGKTLNMSMLKSFFETGCDKSLFHGLRIAEEKELCEMYMGKFPVISISLKDVDGLSFSSACAAMRNVIGKEAMRFQFLQESRILSEKEKELYTQLIKTDKSQDAVFSMSDAVLTASLQTLSLLLFRHYGHKAIILIDEYDVPLDKAFQSGYYQEMVSLIRNMFSSALKGNDSLYFAVLTGCLRVSKESIFTGLNNPNILSVTDVKTKEEIEQLILGNTIDKTVKQELTYHELDTTIDNLWSVLFMTGYLTHRGRIEGHKYRLAVPNLQIRELFVGQIKEWFQETATKDASKLDTFCTAFSAADAGSIERLFNAYLRQTISIRDTFVRKERKENFYHGILLGLLQHKENWSVRSNEESGEGYSDILIEIPESETGIVIEVKYAEDDKLDAGCAEALHQIERKKYESRLVENGMKKIWKYGIACYKKHCKVLLADPE